MVCGFAGQKTGLAQYVAVAVAWRVTFTAPLINAARHVAFLVEGAGKSETLWRVLEGPYQPDVLPSQLIQPVSCQTHWLVDAAAAVRIKTNITRKEAGMSQVDPATDPQVAFKRVAAWRAVAFVQSGMKLGLGTGSTAIYATRRIGELLASGELRDIVAFATSKGTLAEAVRLGIPMLPDDLPVDLDLTIDGVDEVDRN